VKTIIHKCLLPVSYFSIFFLPFYLHCCFAEIIQSCPSLKKLYQETRDGLSMTSLQQAFLASFEHLYDLPHVYCKFLRQKLREEGLNLKFDHPCNMSHRSFQLTSLFRVTTPVRLFHTM
jgi:hypothetical protein